MWHHGFADMEGCFKVYFKVSNCRSSSGSGCLLFIDDMSADKRTINSEMYRSILSAIIYTNMLELTGWTDNEKKQTHEQSVQ